MERDKTSALFGIGSVLPTFSLKNVDGLQVDSEYLRSGAAALVVFSCNHCPYVKAAEESLTALVRQFAPRGLRTVAINANDSSQYPDDSFDRMVAKHTSLSLPYPYLHDETQKVARLFDAACTPEAYLFDAKHQLAYHGAVISTQGSDNAPLATAVQQLLAGLHPKPAFVHPFGCSIKWR